jgi:hypothetical protein
MRRWVSVPLLVVIAFVALVGFVCDSGQHVTVENRSSSAVYVIENGNSPGTVMAPGAEERFAVLRFDGTFTYEVRDVATKQVLASRSFTWQEIRDEGGIILVAE